MSGPAYTVVVPARLASTRLPNKPLVDIGGLPMVVRVVKRLAHLKVNGQPVQVVVACDAAKIMQACTQHDVRAILTSSSHASGSDRLAEACEILGLQGDDIVVNVQGDEPLIDPQLVGAVAALLQANTMASMATAAHPIGSAAEFNNSNVVKVVLDAASNALYFSRAAPRKGSC